MRGILLFVLVSCAGAQTPDPSLTFEVASVKSTMASPGGPVTTKKGGSGSVAPAANPIRFSRRNATLASLISAAYRLQPQQLVCPEWMNSEHYEIDAIAAEGSTQQQQMVMLQNLLAERFQLKVHHEPREIPVYEMVIAKGGPKLVEPRPGGDQLPPFRIGGPFQLTWQDGASSVVLRERGTTEGLATRLAPQAGRPILDRTGLTAVYDFDLRWTPTPLASPSGDAAADPGVNIASALSSQLGLKLESKKAKMDVLVVDGALKVPKEN